MRLAAALLIVVTALTTSGCVVASPDADTYADAAASTLGTAASEVATVEDLLRLLESHKIFSPTVVAQLRYSEDTLAKASQSFGSLNPPPSQDKLNQEVSQLLDDAESLLGDARVAVHRDEKASYSGIADDLRSLATQLQDLEKSAS